MANSRQAPVNPWLQFGGPSMPRLPSAVDAVTNPAPVQQMASSYPGPQPTFLQREAASPGGRLAADGLIGVEKALGFGSKLLGYTPLAPVAPMLQSAADGAAAATQAWQENALAANRNVPGYAERRTQYDRMLAPGNSNLLDQLSPDLEADIGGIVTGLLHGPAAGNAYMDAMHDKLAAYARAHPVSSALARFAGGLLTDKFDGPLDLLGKVTDRMKRMPDVADALKSHPAISKHLSQMRQAFDALGEGFSRLSTLSDANDVLDAVDRAGSSAASPPAPESDAAPSGSLPSLSDRYGMFGNPALRPEIFGDDTGFPSLPSPVVQGGSSSPRTVNLNTPDYLMPGWSPNPGSGIPGPVNLDPSSYGGDYDWTKIPIS